MTSFRHHMERHRTDRVGWLRSAVLGANDGIVSTASLLMGVAAASVSHSGLLMTGVANPVAEAKELTAIYVDRGLDRGFINGCLARKQLLRSPNRYFR